MTCRAAISGRSWLIARGPAAGRRQSLDRLGRARGGRRQSYSACAVPPPRRAGQCRMSLDVAIMQHTVRLARLYSIPEE